MRIHSKLSYADDRPLGEIVNRAARLLRRLADQRLARFGLSSGYLPVVTALMDGGPLSQRVLTEHAGIEQPTMAATLVRMERAGVIERRPDPRDRRSTLFELSSQTLSRSAEIRRAIEELNSEVLSEMSQTDQVMLKDALSTLVNTLQKTVDPPTSA